MVLKSILVVFFLKSGLQTCYGSGDTGHDPVSEQLMDHWRKNPESKKCTTTSGAPVPEPGTVLTCGKYGPMLVQDSFYFESIQHFNRERIPERVVHAKGAGAWGYFTVTNSEITKYCLADLFSKVGKVTKVFCRFSTVNGELGSPDTIRGARGFACKFYTREGNWDLPGLNVRVFPIRDPVRFPSLIHVGKRNPVTHLRDDIMRWDFFSLAPETMMSTLFSFGSPGLPLSFRHMDGFGVNTYKLVNAKGEVVLCKFSLKTHQGLASMEGSEAERLRGEDPDYFMRDLYNCIERKQYPKWTLGVQIMTEKQAKTFRWNCLDATKFWPEEEFPILKIGVLTLNENPSDFFTEVEQAAFCPRRLVPGIEASNDKLLQGRMFSYDDTINYRLTVNNEKNKVNRPLFPEANTHRAGKGRYDDNQGGAPNYVPSSYNAPRGNSRGWKSPFPVYGNVTIYDTMNEDNFSQPTFYWHKISEAERNLIAKNIAAAIRSIPKNIKDKLLDNCRKVHPSFAQKIKAALAES